MNREYKETLAKQIEKNFSNLEEQIMQDIVRRIQKSGKITSTADWQINQLIVLGNSSEDVEKMLKEALDASYPQMFELYDKVIDWEYVRNKDVYEQINQKFIPFEDNLQLRQLTDTIRRQTSDELQNITQSLGFYLDYGKGQRVLTPLAEVYQGYLDQTMYGIATGSFDYNTALRRAVTQLTNSGMRTVDYASGIARRVNVAARSAVMTGVTQLTGHISDYNANTLGTDYFEVAWHAGARPTHQEWQGRVYSREELVSVCGLGTVTGLEGANCYHERYPFIPGLSERNWTDEWLEEQNQKENTPKEFKGKEYTAYEARQRQRQMETAMRAQRQKVKLLQEGGADSDDILLARCKYQGQLDEYAQFSKKMGLVQERERIYLDMLGRISPLNENYKLSDSTDKWAKEALRELKLSEKSIRTRDKEILEVYDKSGKFIMSKKGSAKNVIVTRFEALKMRDCVVSHNHPTGGAFSTDDWNFLRRVKLSELRVVTENTVYYVRRPEKWPKEIDTKEKIQDAVADIKNGLRKKYRKLYQDGIIDKKQRSRMFSEEVSRIFAERYGFDFGKEDWDE